MSRDTQDRWALLRIRLNERGAETEVCKIASRKDVRRAGYEEDVRRAGYEEIAEEDPALARSWRHGNRDKVSDGELLWPRSASCATLTTRTTRSSTG